MTAAARTARAAMARKPLWTGTEPVIRETTHLSRLVWLSFGWPSRGSMPRLPRHARPNGSTLSGRLL